MRDQSRSRSGPSRWRRATAMIAVVALGLAACGTDAEPGPDVGIPGDLEPSDETFRIAVSIDLDTLDPAGMTTTTVENMVEYMVETLTRINEAGEALPHLAHSWDISDDGLVYTFQLVEGVQFHDGEPFNADAVVANLERVTDPDVQVPVRDHLRAIDSVEAIDEHTVQITLANPFPPFVAALSFLAGGMVSPASIQGDAYLDLREPVGTGPYRFSDFRPGELLVVERFDDYWGELPYYGTVEFHVVPEAATRVSQVRAGDMDMTMLPPVSDLTALEADPDVEVLLAPSNRTIFIAINSQAIDDVRIRKAMNHAVDKQAIIERILFGAADPVDAPMHESLWGYCSVGSYEYDPDLARDLLAEAGAEDLEISMIAPTGRYIQDFQVAEAVAGFLSEVGIQVSGPDTMDFPSYIAAIQEPTESRVADIHLLGWAPSFMDAFQHMVQFQTGQHPGGDPGGLATSFYSNAEVDDLLARAASEVDEATRQQLYCDASEIIVDEAPWIFLHSQSFPIVYRAGLENVSYRPNEKFYAVYVHPSTD